MKELRKKAIGKYQQEYGESIKKARKQIKKMTDREVKIFLGIIKPDKSRTNTFGEIFLVAGGDRGYI